MSPALAVLHKDLQLAWRDRSGWLAALAFATISVLVYSFAFDLATSDIRPLLPGVLWTTFLFSGIFVTSQSFQRESETGTFDAMLVAPVAPSAIYVGKLLSNLLSLLLVELAMLVLATILFDTPLLTGELVLVVLIGTVGYVSLATLLSTLGSRARRSHRLRAVAAAARDLRALERHWRRTALPRGERPMSALWRWTTAPRSIRIRQETR